MRGLLRLATGSALLASGCVHHDLPDVRASDHDVAVVDRREASGLPEPGPCERWIEAHAELRRLVDECVETRAALEREVRSVERTERVATGVAIAAYVTGALVASRRGTTVIGPPPSSYSPGYRYGVPSPASSGGPTLASFGARPQASGGPSLSLGVTNPLAERTDLLALDAAHRIDAMDVEIDAAYADLESSRGRTEFGEADEERLATHEARLRLLCSPPR